MARAWKLGYAMRERIEQVWRLRSVPIPTDAQLAHELGVSRRAIQWHMRRLRLLGNPRPTSEIVVSNIPENAEA